MDEQNVAVEQDTFDLEAEEVEATEPIPDEVPPHWQVRRVGEIAQVLYGKARPHEEGLIPVIGSGGVYGYTSEPLTTDETLVIGRKGSAGTVYYSSGPCYPSDTTFYLQWKQEVCVPFIYHTLLHKGLAPDKSVIPSLQRGDVESFNIPLPPLSEQRAIAHTLRMVQEAIQARRREMELEREHKAALMQHLFTHGTCGEPTKQTEIGEIPESWGIERLDSCLQIGLRNGLYKSSEAFGKGSTRIVELGTLYDSERVLSVGTNLRLIDASADEINRYSLQSGDVLINRVSKRYEGVAQARLFHLPPEKSPPVVFESNMFRARFHPKKINSAFFSFYSSADSYYFQVLAKAQKGNQTSINQPAICSILTPVPSLTEQQEIASILSTNESKITTLEQETTLLEELFRALLEELMTGRLSVAPLFAMEVAR